MRSIQQENAYLPLPPACTESYARDDSLTSERVRHFKHAGKDMSLWEVGWHPAGIMIDPVEGGTTEARVRRGRLPRRSLQKNPLVCIPAHHRDTLVVLPRLLCCIKVQDG